MTKNKNNGGKKKNAKNNGRNTAAHRRALSLAVLRSQLPLPNVRGAARGTNAHGQKNFALAKQVCSVSNPFCEEAIGARWPDNSFERTIGYSITNQPISLLSSSGQNALLFIPDAKYQYVTAASIAGGVISWSGTSTQLVTGITDSRWRITSWGLKLRVVSSVMNTTGMCRVRLFSPTDYSQIGSSAIAPTFADASYDVTLASLIEKELHIIPMPISDNARLWQPNSNTNAGWGGNKNAGWQVVQVCVDGAYTTSQACLEIAVFYNYEFSPLVSDSNYAFTVAPTVENLAVQHGNANVLHKVGNFVEGATRAVDTLFMAATGGMGALVKGARLANAAYDAYQSYNHRGFGKAIMVD
jgi:hypothetical protein